MYLEHGGKSCVSIVIAIVIVIVVPQPPGVM